MSSSWKTIDKGFQIHYTGNFHWVMSCRLTPDEILLFDSLNKPVAKMTETLKRQLRLCYLNPDTKESIIVTRLEVQKQPGSVRCGLFALAFAYHISKGKEAADIQKINFETKKLHHWLFKSLTRGQMNPPPVKSNGYRKKRENMSLHYTETDYLPTFYLA